MTEESLAYCTSPRPPHCPPGLHLLGPGSGGSCWSLAGRGHPGQTWFLAGWSMWGKPGSWRGGACGANLVSRAFRGLFRGCCSRQLTAGLPATGTAMALSTRDVMACTASTLICVLSTSSCKDSSHVSASTASHHPPAPQLQGGMTAPPHRAAPHASHACTPRQTGGANVCWSKPGLLRAGNTTFSFSKDLIIFI